MIEEVMKSSWPELQSLDKKQKIKGSKKKAREAVLARNWQYACQAILYGSSHQAYHPNSDR